MKVGDVMTRRVMCVAPDSSIYEAVRRMLQHKISGLPVVDAKGDLVGIITEGDFLRRAETGTDRKRSRWLEFLVGPGRLARDYVRSHACKVEEAMSPDVLTVSEDAELDEVVALMERHHIKRLPVMRGRNLVGIISRANLLHALAGIAREISPGPKSDETIRDGVLAELDRQVWASKHLVDVVVRNGVVELWGTVLWPEEREAARVAAETVPGVKEVRSHITWVEPMSGIAFSDPDEEARDANPPPASTPPSSVPPANVRQAVN